MRRTSGTRSKVKVGENKGEEGKEGVWCWVCVLVFVQVGSDLFYGVTVRHTEMLSELVWIEIEM